MRRDVLRCALVTAQADSNPPGDYYCPTCEKTFHVADRCPNDGARLVKLATRIDPFLGREIDGRYTILEKLGQGGMGAVYRAQQHAIEREVAIKVVSPHLISDIDVIKRFLREAKLAGKLSHPNAVAVLDSGSTEDGVFYLVMELVVGRTLDQVIKAEKQFRPERVVRIGTQVCDALDGAHALQIVHRDLKPANIMLLSQGKDLVKVLDFGLAKSVAPDQTSTTMTNAGALLGTPAYMPPELALGQPCDGRADLYSLGVVLYLLGSGHLPFESDSAHELIAMHGTDVAPPMTGVPPALSKVIDRMLEKKPEARYQTAAEARDALEAALDGRVLTPLPWTTSPSLGPFPAQSADFAALDSAAPRAVSDFRSGPVGKKPRSATEMDRLVSSDTLGVQDAHAARPARRALIPALVATGVVAAAVITFVAVRGGTGDDAPSEPPRSREVVGPPAEKPAAPAPAPVVKQAPASAEPPATAVEIRVDPKPEPKPEPKPKPPPPKVEPKHPRDATVAKPPRVNTPKKPPKTAEQPLPPPPPPPPPHDNAGSAATTSGKKLPF
jgi:serine/threonine protein kinase